MYDSSKGSLSKATKIKPRGQHRLVQSGFAGGGGDDGQVAQASSDAISMSTPVPPPKQSVSSAKKKDVKSKRSQRGDAAGQENPVGGEAHEEDLDSGSQSETVLPGAVAVRGFNARASVASNKSLDDAEEAKATSSFFVADLVSKEDIRREYLAEFREEILGSAVEAEVVDEKKQYFGFRTCVVAAIVLAVAVSVIVAVVVHKNRNGHAETSPILSPSETVQQSCAMMTEYLNSNTSLRAWNQSVGIPNCEINGDDETCTYDVGSNATKASALCSRFGGKFAEEDFTMMCNTSTPNRTFVANFLHNYVCVAASCNASQAESYLEAQIIAQMQFLAGNGYHSCAVLFGTYTYPGTSQQVLYLPSIWGEQCAMEFESITSNINLTKAYNSTVLPSCQRNGSQSTCIVDFSFEAFQNGPRCARIGGSPLEYDAKFQCISQDGGVYAIEHLHQPVCTGVSCNLNQVRYFTANSFRSSLANQGYQNCQLLLSNLTNSQNASELQLNESLVLGGEECSTATSVFSSNSILAALYEAVSASPSAPGTSDFSSLVAEAQSLCAQLGGRYVEEDFTIMCDSTVPKGGTYIYNFLHVFLCLGTTCNATEIDSYLEWPIISHIQNLENGGHVHNCQVPYGSYQVESGPTEYLPSVWGEQCATENNALSSKDALATTLSSSAVILPSCQQHGREFNCTTDYSGANAQVEASCLSLRGQYIEIDYAFTCAYRVGTFAIETLHEPHCTGISCDVNQTFNYALELAKLNLESQGLQNCQLRTAHIEKPYQNVSTQHLNTSSEDCVSTSNNLSVNPQWALLNSRAAQSPANCHYTSGNSANCTYDSSLFIDQADALCTTLGGQNAAINFTTSCFQSGFDVTYNYIDDFFCFGRPCLTSQVNSYLEGIVVLETLRNNCSLPG